MADSIHDGETPIAERRLAVRRQLDASVVQFEVDDRTESSIAFHGVSRYGATLVGPPGRLHGGLHAYARVFPVLRAIDAHARATTFPCRLSLALRKPIVLETDVPFVGRYREGGDGYSLTVQHDGTEKLDASLERIAEGPVDLARFRALYRSTRDEAPVTRMRVGPDSGTAVYREAIVIEADPETRRVSPGLAVFLAEDESVDPALVCILLDVVAAVSLSAEVGGLCYTVRIDLDLFEGRIGRDVDLVAIADRRYRPDPRVDVRPVDVSGRAFGPTAIEVLLADRAMTRAYAHGTVTMIPARIPRPS